MSTLKPVCIVGAGFSGAVIARELAEAGIHSELFEQRAHVAGNCHTEKCPITGITLHQYGPHIFHTDLQHVWNYVNRYGEFMPFTLRIKTTYKGHVYQLPINLHTLNQFYGKAMCPAEAEAFLKTRVSSTTSVPRNFEEQALCMVGPELYEAFFKEYTEKQWGRDPKTLPASILKRLPIRFNYDDNYFFHPYQGIPKDGYTSIIEKILDHPLITLHLNTPAPLSFKSWAHTFYSGPIDQYFRYQKGRLPYRTLHFQSEVHPGDYQGTALMNYPEKATPYTRINEHKHFAPWESHHQTVITKEYPADCQPEDTPFYPVRLAKEQALLKEYEALATSCAPDVTFIGRLGTYQYLDMDKTIALALHTAQNYRKSTSL